MQQQLCIILCSSREFMKALPPMATMKKPAMEGFLQVDRSNLTGTD
jgi:hypothetical protein